MMSGRPRLLRQAPCNASYAGKRIFCLAYSCRWGDFCKFCFQVAMVSVSFCRRKTFHPQWKPIHYGLTCPTQEKSQPTLGCTGEISQRCYYSYYYYPRDVSLIHSALPNPSLCCFIDQSPFSFCRVSLFCYSLFCSLLFCFIYLSPLECNCCEKRN